MRDATRARSCLAAVALVLSVAGEARAAEAPSVDDDTIIDPEVLGPPGVLRARADRVSFDPSSRALELDGDVRVDGPPFHLRAQRISLARTRYGLEITGKGQLAFCPCLGTPLTLGFDGAVVAPPGDLVLEHPSLRVYGVPVFALPYFWLRSEEKLGVLPPDLAYRGKDGLFAGGGVHIPWRQHGTQRSLDLRAGAYFLGGVVLDGRLRTPSSTTKVRLDRLPSAPSPALPFTSPAGDDGLLVDARGRAGDVGHEVAWDVDMLRGRRGVAATTDLEAAARPWDRAAGEASLRGGAFTVSTGALAVSRRGGGLGDVDAAGPVSRVRASGGRGAFTWDATVEGGALRVAGSAARAGAPDTVSFARAEAGARATTTLDALELSASARAAGDVAMEASRDGSDRTATARARAALPMAQAFADEGEGPRRSPLVHVVEPFAEAAILHARGDALLGVLPGRGAAVLEGTAPLARAGVVTSLGRWSSRESAELEASAGAAFGSEAVASRIRPLVRARASASARLVGLTGDASHVPGEGAVPEAWAGTARARVGGLEGPRLLADVAFREGGDPVLARALADAPTQAPLGFFAREGTTGGATVVVPWTPSVSTSAGVDADLGEGELVGARGGLELRDRCGCVTLRVLGSHRLGRRGVDVWLALDFAAGR